MSSYDRRTAANPFIGNPDLTKKGWDVGNAVLHEYKALKQIQDAIASLRTVHAQNAPIWRALKEDLYKVDPQFTFLKDKMLSATGNALWVGIDLSGLQLQELERAVDHAIKDCDSVHKNLADILP